MCIQTFKSCLVRLLMFQENCFSIVSLRVHSKTGRLLQTYPFTAPMHTGMMSANLSTLKTVTDDHLYRKRLNIHKHTKFLKLNRLKQKGYLSKHNYHFDFRVFLISHNMIHECCSWVPVPSYGHTLVHPICGP